MVHDSAINGSHHPTKRSLQRDLSIQKCLQVLLHSSRCRVADCGMRCLRMKKLVSHTAKCEKKMTVGCCLCKQVIALAYHHAKVCQVTNCPVSFCCCIKQRLRKMKTEDLEQKEQH